MEPTHDATEESSHRGSKSWMVEYTVEVDEETHRHLTMIKASDVSDVHHYLLRELRKMYQTSAKVKQLSRKGGVDPGKIDVLREYRFEGIYPNVVSSVPLDYGATDQIEEFQVTFNYLFYEVETAGLTSSN